MRISATTLQSFYLFSRNQISEASLLATIYRSPITNSRMRLGAAYGLVLADPTTYRTVIDSFDGYVVPDYPEFRFPSAMVDPALATIDRAGAFEGEGTHQYGPHTVVAHADHLHLRTRTLTEFKTRRGGAIDAAKYHRSYQWRFMADIFEPDVIAYRVFRLTVRPMRFVEQQPFVVYQGDRAAEIHTQCCRLLERFVAFVAARPGLEAYLPNRKADRPPAPALPAWEVAFAAFQREQATVRRRAAIVDLPAVRAGAGPLF